MTVVIRSYSRLSPFKKPKIFIDSWIGLPIALKASQRALKSRQYADKVLSLFDRSCRLRRRENSRAKELLLKFSASESQTSRRWERCVQSPKPLRKVYRRSTTSPADPCRTSAHTEDSPLPPESHCERWFWSEAAEEWHR